MVIGCGEFGVYDCCFLFELWFEFGLVGCVVSC